jgi:hypothetical protein
MQMLEGMLHVRGEAKAILSMQHMPLTRAYLCEDCNCIGNCAEQCPACASRALIGLAGVLNREEKVEFEPEMAHIHALVA